MKLKFLSAVAIVSLALGPQRFCREFLTSAALSLFLSRPSGNDGRTRRRDWPCNIEPLGGLTRTTEIADHAQNRECRMLGSCCQNAETLVQHGVSLRKPLQSMAFRTGLSLIKADHQPRVGVQGVSFRFSGNRSPFEVLAELAA